MPRYFVWIRVAPVVLDGTAKHVLAIRTIRAADPHEALAQGMLAVRRELLHDLGSAALRDATFALSEISQPVWYNWRRPHVNFFLEPEEPQPVGSGATTTGAVMPQHPQ